MQNCKCCPSNRKSPYFFFIQNNVVFYNFACNTCCTTLNVNCVSNSFFFLFILDNSKGSESEDESESESDSESESESGSEDKGNIFLFIQFFFVM